MKTNFTIKPLRCSFLWMIKATIFVPYGASGVVLKLKSQNVQACGDKLRVVLEDLNRFRVMLFCANNLSLSESGKFGSAPANGAL